MDSSVATVSAEKVAEGRERILAELRKVIVGQDEVVEQVLIALFTGGHCLITGVPGLAKTLLIKTLADILDLDFKRIQFTPDLMPSDITGTEILDEEQGTRRLRFVKGPIFAQIILADEINRTPPKTQAALLEAMQEYHVTAAGRTYPLERPFFVLATQNPIELEGTYPLPEAQLDRFMFNIVITYLSEDDEVTVVTQTTGDGRPHAGADSERRRHPAVPGARAAGRHRRGDRALRRAAGRTRRGRAVPGAPEFVEKWVKWGAGLRGSQALVRGAQGARADARPLSRVDQGHPGAGQADPAPPHHDQLLRRVGAHQLRRDHRAAARGGAGAEERDVSDAVDRARSRQFLDPGGRRAPRHARAEGAHRSSKGFLSGLHRSPFKGFSVEFAEYRQYIPGDDLATIDWKVYARSDRYYVKKFEEETNLDCHLLLDVSGSMGYGSHHGMTKFEYGACLAASLGYLMNRQRDAVGLTAFDERIVDDAAGERASRATCARCWSRSIACDSASETNVVEAAAPARRRAHQARASSC